MRICISHQAKPRAKSTFESLRMSEIAKKCSDSINLTRKNRNTVTRTAKTMYLSVLRATTNPGVCSVVGARSAG